LGRVNNHWKPGNVSEIGGDVVRASGAMREIAVFLKLPPDRRKFIASALFME
jgi:hypothetical protein